MIFSLVPAVDRPPPAIWNQPMPTMEKTTNAAQRTPAIQVQYGASLIGRGQSGPVLAQEDVRREREDVREHVPDVARHEDAEEVADEEDEEDVDLGVEGHRGPGHVPPVERARAA